MKIFVTGIAGFIGFHLARYLKKRGDEVWGCDDFNAYYDPELKRQRAALLREEGIEVIEADICAPAPIERVIVREKISHFVHLAAQAGVRYSVSHPEKYVQSNLDGFVQILELIRRHPQIKLIYASSSSVYGSNRKIPFAETDPTDCPCSLYGATKKADELLAHSYHHLYGLAVTGLRFFTVYGPWGRPDMAYFSFADAISRGKPIQVFNHGKMSRDFTFIDDIVRGTAAAIDLGAGCEIFNLGNNHPEEVGELISLIEEYLGQRAVIEYLPMQLGDVPVTFADISKSKRMLDFEPKTTLRSGMHQFLEWFCKNNIASGR